MYHSVILSLCVCLTRVFLCDQLAIFFTQTPSSFPCNKKWVRTFCAIFENKLLTQYFFVASPNVQTSALLSFILFVILAGGILSFKDVFAEKDFLRLVGGFLCSLLFVLALTVCDVAIIITFIFFPGHWQCRTNYFQWKPRN